MRKSKLSKLTPKMMCYHNIISRNEKNRSILVILQIKFKHVLFYIFRKWEHFQITKFDRIYMAGWQALSSSNVSHTHPLNISEILTSNLAVLLIFSCSFHSTWQDQVNSMKHRSCSKNMQNVCSFYSQNNNILLLAKMADTFF